MVEKGLLLLLDWIVLDMPGLSPMSSLDFKDQQVPPPRRAWISADATDKELLFGADRKLRQPTDSNVASLATDRMYKLHLLSQRLTLMNTITPNKFVTRQKVMRISIILECLQPKKNLLH